MKKLKHIVHLNKKTGLWFYTIVEPPGSDGNPTIIYTSPEVYETKSRAQRGATARLRSLQGAAH